MRSLFIHSVLSVVFPTFCPICGKQLVENQDEICTHCLNLLPRTDEINIEGNITEDKFRDIPNVVRGAAWLKYTHQNTTGHLVRLFKYKNHPRIGYYLGQAAAKEYIPSDFFNTIDLIIPVPLHPKRLRERGYNQAEWIARGLSAETGIPVDTDHIQRVEDNQHQATLFGRDRVMNVSEIFEVNHPEELYRKHILLVDDVITTGATMRSCIMATTPVRGCRISVFSLAKAMGG